MNHNKARKESRFAILAKRDSFVCTVMGRKSVLAVGGLLCRQTGLCLDFFDFFIFFLIDSNTDKEQSNNSGDIGEHFQELGGHIGGLESVGDCIGSTEN